MVSRTTPPSSVSGGPTDRGTRSRPRVDAREWLGGIRLSGFMMIMLSLVVLGVFVLVPTFGTYLDQRQQIDALESSIAVTEQEIADLETEAQSWSDPAYIITQARERLYYILPGEVVYLVDNDLAPAEIPAEQEPVSEDVEQTQTDWMAQLLRSVTQAGLAESGVPSAGDGSLSP